MRKTLAASLFIGSIVFGGVAQANTIVTESFTGTITSAGPHNGEDVAGYFGTVNASLAGETVTFSFTYDATKLAAGTYLTGPQYEDYSVKSDPSAASETIAVNGASLTATSITGAAAGGSSYTPGCNPALYMGVQGADSSQFEVDLCGASYAYGTGIPLSQATVDSYTAGASSAVLYLFNGQSQDILYVSGIHAVTPEPATWLSALTAFGAAVLLRRRRA
ncbi:MAG TPA: PEP-CTERM sorting domain-containing protein [Bryobacteraceae bacterium]|jgi:hypothetical protein